VAAAAVAPAVLQVRLLRRAAGHSHAVGAQQRKTARLQALVQFGQRHQPPAAAPRGAEPAAWKAAMARAGQLAVREMALELASWLIKHTQSQDAALALHLRRHPQRHRAQHRRLGWGKRHVGAP
jgi:hypothetical protein